MWKEKKKNLFRNLKNIKDPVKKDRLSKVVKLIESSRNMKMKFPL